LHARGDKVREFYSYCSGLPVPECADNPLRFKFSWSPRGALHYAAQLGHFSQGW
jgi:saccharopine dehydrogenase (NADP+, L-glutamate forming)